MIIIQSQIKTQKNITTSAKLKIKIYKNKFLYIWGQQDHSFFPFLELLKWIQLGRYIFYQFNIDINWYSMS